jgi:hypothetical protein
MADIARIIEVVEPEAKALGFDLVRVRCFKGVAKSATRSSSRSRSWPSAPRPASW